MWLWATGEIPATALVSQDLKLIKMKGPEAPVGFSVWNAQRQTQAASVTGGTMEVEKWSGAHLAGP